ncbi:MAG: 4Fe-4S dicluster domain-containing protein [Clostridiales bacterium]|nr:4Fe-4S dicluster domain-containing protein [Clostridiales bacterium]
MKKILIDDAKCMACHTCEIACCIAHSRSGTLYGAIAEQALPASGMHVEPGGGGRGFPLGCRHCQDPQCVRACVTKALSMNPEGVIVCDKKRCIGCLMCFIACPFGAIEEGVKEAEAYSISKCDLCEASGDEPACVNACPTKALVFEEPDSFSKNKRIKYLVEMAASSEAAPAQE